MADKSPHHHNVKKVGRSLKAKRIAKQVKRELRRGPGDLD